MPTWVNTREAPGQHQAREELPVVHHALGPSSLRYAAYAMSLGLTGTTCVVPVNAPMKLGTCLQVPKVLDHAGRHRA